MKILASLLIALSLFSAKAEWRLLQYYPGYVPGAAPATNGAIASFVFPPSAQGQLFPAFLVYVQGTTMDLRDTQLACSFLLNSSSNAVFRFGGQGTWNNGPTPPHCRLYFSSLVDYSNVGYGTNYWFHKSRVNITNTLSVSNLTAMLTNHMDWSDGQGQSNSNAWQYAASRAKTVGLAFGGGSFYDIGIAMVQGNADFNLLSFTCNPPFRVQMIGRFEGNNYGVEYSTNLAHWTNIMPPNPSAVSVRGKKL